MASLYMVENNFHTVAKGHTSNNAGGGLGYHDPILKYEDLSKMVQ